MYFRCASSAFERVEFTRTIITSGWFVAPEHQNEFQPLGSIDSTRVAAAESQYCSPLVVAANLLLGAAMIVRDRRSGLVTNGDIDVIAVRLFRAMRWSPCFPPNTVLPATNCGGR